MDQNEDRTARFLIIRLSSIGDIVLTTPAIRGLREQVDHARIHFLVKEKFLPVVKANPYIDKIHVFRGSLKQTIRELKKEKFDYIIDLHRNLRSFVIKNRLQTIAFSFRKLNFRKWLLVRWKINRMPDIHIVDRYMETLRLFDVKNDRRGLDYFIPPEEEPPAGTLPESFRMGYVLFSIGGMHATKKLTPEQIETIVRKMNLPVVLAGGQAEKNDGDRIVLHSDGIPVWNTCGLLSINQSAALVRDARVVITHDTGLMHIAAAFNKKIISVWGNTIPGFGMYPYLPHPDSRMFEVKGLNCRPCAKIGYKRCPRKHFNCMLRQDLDELAGYCERLFYKS